MEHGIKNCYWFPINHKILLTRSCCLSTCLNEEDNFIILLRSTLYHYTFSIQIVKPSPILCGCCIYISQNYSYYTHWNYVDRETNHKVPHRYVSYQNMHIGYMQIYSLQAGHGWMDWTLQCKNWRTCQCHETFQLMDVDSSTCLASSWEYFLKR
jgi:hypothetical protein